MWVNLRLQGVELCVAKRQLALALTQRVPTPLGEPDIEQVHTPVASSIPTTARPLRSSPSAAGERYIHADDNGSLNHANEEHARREQLHRAEGSNHRDVDVEYLVVGAVSPDATGRAQMADEKRRDRCCSEG